MDEETKRLLGELASDIVTWATIILPCFESLEDVTLHLLSFANGWMISRKTSEELFSTFISTVEQIAQAIWAEHEGDWTSAQESYGFDAVNISLN